MKATKHPKPKELLADRIESIGRRFEEAATRADLAQNEVSELKKVAESLAKEHGKESSSGKGKFLRGQNYVLSYYERGGTLKLDEDGFKNEFPAWYKLCTRSVAVFDEALFEKLVLAKKIPASAVKKHTAKGKPTIIVKIERHE